MKNFLNGIIRSYSQVFFSQSNLLGVFIMVITFFFPELGLCGLIGIVSAQFLAVLLKLNEHSLQTGYFGYNALLVALGLGATFELNIQLIIITFLAGFLTLFVQIAVDGFVQKYRLPSLSIPFFITLTILMLALKNNPVIVLTERSIYSLNTVFSYGGVEAVKFYEYVNNNLFPTAWQYFFISIGSIFFQDTVIAGLVIFFGILLFSRISTMLAVIGFFSAYYFMKFIGFDTTQLSPFFLGYNFILTAIAVGGYFLIPSTLSFVWSVILVPITVLVTYGFSKLLEPWQLAVYSLPFNFIVLLSVYILYFRNHSRTWLNETVYQEYMPEKNLYSFKNYLKRFGNNLFSKVQILLPFWGQWTVWQGYNGKYTHKDNFRYAFDFVITNNGKTYSGAGIHLTDYYCYNKMVLAPADGIVVKIVDGVPDNKIGEVNTLQNWGNTIVIKHSENLYSQLNHLKEGSIRVKEGDYVLRGQPLAAVGNSGRSPQPHLHFQLQQYPFVGSYTIKYPFSRFISVRKDNKILKFYDVPEENEIIENITLNSILSKAFYFYPGQVIEVIQSRSSEPTKKFEWEVLTDSLNNTYIHCKKTNSFAYIHNDGLSHVFKAFYGKKNSPLYYFYQFCYHVEFSNMQVYQIEDFFTLHHVFNFAILFFHDFFAPFYTFLKAKYQLTSTSNANINDIELNATVSKLIFKKAFKITKASIFIENHSISKIIIYDRKKTTLQFIFKERFD